MTYPDEPPPVMNVHADDPVDEVNAFWVLATASGYDEREASDMQARVWATALGVDRVTVAEAVGAVHRYYRDNPDGRIRPGHVTAYVLADRVEARAAARVRRAIDGPPDAIPVEEGAARFRAALAAHRAGKRTQEAAEKAAEAARVAGVQQRYTELSESLSVELSGREDHS